MNINFFKWSVFALLTSASQLCLAEAGKVIFAIGDVVVQNQQRVAVKKGDSIEVGDTVITGDKSRAQLIMSDGARISIRANSELLIEQYAYNANEANQVSATQSKSSMSLLKGGFRTITGAVASGQDKSGYEVKTAVATIGIRGTDYTILLCNDDCISLGVDSNENIKNGLYAGVSKGAIVLKNSAGELFLNPAESGFVKNISSFPVKLLGPPSSLFGETTATKKSQEQEQESSDTSDVTAVEEIVASSLETQIEQITSQPIQTELKTDITITQNDAEVAITQPEITTPKVIQGNDGTDIPITDGQPPIIPPSSQTAFSLASMNNTSGITQQIEDTTKNILDSDNNLVGFSALNNGRFQQLAIGTASQKNLGFDQRSGFRWGRWSNGIALIDNTALDLNQQSLHWLNNTDFDPSIALPKSGLVSYSLIGNTDPTNNHGARGILGNATFTADFTNQQVQSQLLIGISGLVWRASGTGSIANGFNSFSGLYNSVNIDAKDGGTGQFSGFFSSKQNELQLPNAAGLVYSLSNLTGDDIVSGAVVFSHPKYQNR